MHVGAPRYQSIQAPGDWELQELLRGLTLELESWPPPLLLLFSLVSSCAWD